MQSDTFLRALGAIQASQPGAEMTHMDQAHAAEGIDEYLALFPTGHQQQGKVWCSDAPLGTASITKWFLHTQQWVLERAARAQSSTNAPHALTRSMIFRAPPPPYTCMYAYTHAAAAGCPRWAGRHTLISSRMSSMRISLTSCTDRLSKAARLSMLFRSCGTTAQHATARHSAAQVSACASTSTSTTSGGHGTGRACIMKEERGVAVALGLCGALFH